MKLKANLIFVLLTVLASCGQVEFPKEHLAPVKQPTDLTKYELTFEEIMKFYEGELAEYAVKAKVPSGEPVVAVTGLPSGATFSPDTGLVSWRVPKGYVVTPDPKENNQSFDIRIHLRGSEDPAVVLVRKAVLLVYKSK